MPCGHCGKSGHNTTTCPKRLSSIIEDHGKRISSLERTIKFLTWMFTFIQLWVGIIAAVTTVFMKFTEFYPLLNAANIFTLIVASFLGGFLLGWLIRAIAYAAYKRMHPEKDDYISTD